jgi:hypothetical protein
MTALGRIGLSMIVCAGILRMRNDSRDRGFAAGFASGMRASKGCDQ